MVKIATFAKPENVGSHINKTIEMNEFAEIGRTGTIVEFINRRGQYSQRITNNNSTCIKIYQICVDYEGNILDIVGIFGMGQQMIYKQPSVLVSLFSDDEDFFGKVVQNANNILELVLYHKVTIVLIADTKLILKISLLKIKKTSLKVS